MIFFSIIISGTCYSYDLHIIIGVPYFYKNDTQHLFVNADKISVLYAETDRTIPTHIFVHPIFHRLRCFSERVSAPVSRRKSDCIRIDQMARNVE